MNNCSIILPNLCFRRTVFLSELWKFQPTGSRTFGKCTHAELILTWQKKTHLFSFLLIIKLDSFCFEWQASVCLYEFFCRCWASCSFPINFMNDQIFTNNSKHFVMMSKKKSGNFSISCSIFFLYKWNFIQKNLKIYFVNILQWARVSSQQQLQMPLSLFQMTQNEVDGKNVISNKKHEFFLRIQWVAMWMAYSMLFFLFVWAQIRVSLSIWFINYPSFSVYIHCIDVFIFLYFSSWAENHLQRHT